MKVAIYTRGIENEHKHYFKELIDSLKQNNFEIICHTHIASTTQYIPELGNIAYFNNNADLPADTNFFITLGGDGTILDAVNFIGQSQIPLVGINFGRLGFLAATSKNQINNLVQSLVQHTFKIEQRTLINVTASNPIFGSTPFALNELTLHKIDISPMIKIHTYLNGEFLNTYWSDGLIISTPTGSTGYNLSCNGPIIFPNSNTFAITPIAPHNLNNRPIIVPDDTVLTFEVEGRTNHFLCTLDARREIVNINTTIAVRKEKFYFNLLQLPENIFLNTLRNKLGWGSDVRN
jgi:NAD+ kinase